MNMALRLSNSIYLGRYYVNTLVAMAVLRKHGCGSGWEWKREEFMKELLFWMILGK